ncbi:MAG TPA: SLBB domain-containing protein [Gammaproteobacteria bacterium]
MKSPESVLRRFIRSARVALFGVAVCLSWAAFAQVPIPTQEQIELFNSLSPSQQSALLQELQSNLPPAQRQAVLDMLRGRVQPAQQPPSTQPAGIPELDRALQEQRRRREAAPEENGPPRFRGGDTLVIEFEPRDEEPDARREAEAEETLEFQERLANGNPYELDRQGQLYLPGIPPIALGGLNIEEAKVRLEAEAALRPFEIEITRLPLDPIGIEALEPYGYDIFEEGDENFRPPRDIPVPANYVVGPGDTLNVQLFGNRNAEYFLPVSRDGFISFPEIGPINVSGLSFTDARDLINQRIAEQLIGVRASITLGELRTIQVFVVGDVEQPGSYTVGGLSTITHALFASGGVRRIGSLRRIELRRNGETVSVLDLYDLLLRGDASADVRLQPGDVVFVPPIGPTISVDGEVKRPAVYEITEGTTVGDVLALAGGLRPTANRAMVRIERVAPGGGTDVEQVDVSTASGRQVEVRDGDVLRVTPSPSLLESAVRLVGNVVEEGLHEWREGMRLSDLLPSPARLKPLSDLNYVLIRRELEPNVELDVLSADLEAAWANPGGPADIALEPRDTVYVFNLNIGRAHIVGPLLEEMHAQARPQAPERVVRIGGRVRAPGDYPLEPGMLISDLLRAGGGLSESAYASEAELTRYVIVDGQYRETSLIDIDLAAVLRGDPVADIAVAPYDYLNIKEVPRWRGNETVTLRGEVMFPGRYPIRQGEKLSSVLERAGGLTALAFPEGSVFTRVELRQREREQLETLARRIESDLATLSLSDPQNTDAITTGQSLLNQLRNAVATGRLVIRLDEIVEGNPAADIALRDGDVLIVPQYRQEVTVIGEVQYPTSHVYDPALDRRDYLNRSGGLTSRADEGRIYVVRANGEVVTDGTARRWFRRSGATEIRPGDTIVVPTDVDRVRPLARWSSVTQVLYNLAIAAAAVNSF